MALKRGMVLLGCAAAVAFGSVLSASPAAAKECPWGTSPTRWEGVCSPGGSGGTAGGGAPIAPAPAAGGARIVNTPGSLSTVNGIPCTEEHYGTCLAMIQNN
ncbi:hypothetical protein [Mycolicibacterium arenosum]|uniref:Intersectin-EH binding protein Ibp1 n=1 Tax=Mycolicibacterium arenosum TaxID=2952157 RepID=A0ABT1M7A3_9MYCO|nr:hypothetical protein [Mycolicibacterium sp. CAU 1645]MCP9275008.1 hypothetical protein [Mycolicibacterium sp. CAU 1645]